MSGVDLRWRRIQDLAHEAELRPAAERTAWLAAAEPDDHEIRAEALALTEALEAEATANRLAATGTDAGTLGPAAIPSMIGQRYRIVERIGSGGRGIVYRAIRDAGGGIVQEVAVKVLGDHLSRPEDLERFRREQRILAGLQHPSIARFIEAGVDADGRPFLAIEWIDGVTIDVYAQTVEVRERVRCMAETLDALQAAHQSLVVHLDLKPSNILVDRAGKVRLIDFGTAKLMGDGLATETRQLTPSFASPEQLRGEPASTASDVYSAALTLYRLVAGEAAGAGPQSMVALAERATRDEAPALRVEDLDLRAILEKAMQFQPAARYRGASEFADDLRAWLDGRPVTARRPTVRYRVGRFLARNRKAAAAVALALIAMASLAGYALWQQRLRLREAERSEAIATFLRRMITSSATAASGNPEMTVLDMVRRAHRRIEDGASMPGEVGALLQSDFAFFAREAGQDRQAEEFAKAALRRAESSGNTGARLLSRKALAETVLRLGRCEEAVALFREADGMARSPKDALGAGDVPDYLAARAVVKSRCEGDPAGAAALLRAGIAAAADPVTRSSLANSLALELARLRRFDECRQVIAEGLRDARSHADGRYFEVALHRMLGQMESSAGRHAESLAALEEARRLAPGVATEFEILRLDLMAAGQQADLGLYTQAVGRAAGISAEAGRRETALGAARWMLYADAAEVMARARDCARAMELYRRVDDITKGRIPRDWRGNRLFYSAECAVFTGGPRKAAELAREALDTYGGQLPANSPRRERLEKLTRGGPVLRTIR